MTDGTDAAPSGPHARPSQEHARTDLPPPTPSGRRRSPNYAARRMLVTTVGITAVVAAGVLGWGLLRDDPARTAAGSTAWNQVVFVDRATGAVSAVDPDDATQFAAQAPATARVTAVHVQGERVALVQPDQITLTGLGDEAPTIVPTQLGSVVTRVEVDDALWLAVGSKSGGNVLLVDGLTGVTYDVAALSAPTQIRVFLETLRHDVTGTTFAMADAENFQTIVIHTDVDPPTAAFFPDQPIAVADDLVVTSQVVGQQADLALLDPDRRELAKVSGELPVGGLLIDGKVTVISSEGSMTRFAKDDTEAERLGTVAVPAGAGIRWVRPTADDTRFVVFGDVFEAVVDLDARTVFTTTFAEAVDPPTIAPGWRCLPVGGGDTYHSLVDLESGEQIADLTGMAVTGIAADGCTVIGTRAGVVEVVGDGGSVQLGQLRAATLAPDGRAVVEQTSAGVTRLVRIDNWELGEPIDLTSLAPTNPIVSFRNA